MVLNNLFVKKTFGKSYLIPINIILLHFATQVNILRGKDNILFKCNNVTGNNVTNV